MIDIDKHKKTKLELTTQKGSKIVMSEYEISRWACLIEAIDIIDKKCDQLGVRANDIKWEKPIAIQKYIDERTESMLFEIESEMKQEKVCTTSRVQR
jgi:DNA repair exonuclease SbcCD nuclease subunit